MEIRSTNLYINLATNRKRTVINMARTIKMPKLMYIQNFSYGMCKNAWLLKIGGRVDMQQTGHEFVHTK